MIRDNFATLREHCVLMILNLLFNTAIHPFCGSCQQPSPPAIQTMIEQAIYCPIIDVHIASASIRGRT